MVFDVGAHTGESVVRFKSLFPRCTLHAFEPSLPTFTELQANTRGIGNLTLVQAGVGRLDGAQTLLENSASVMTSFLTPSEDARGAVVNQREVDMVTLDTYCSKNQIDFIDLLKIDTQGYDLEALRGAEGLLTERRIRIVQSEVIFSDMYRGSAPLDDVYAFMTAHYFRLLGFYNWHVDGGAAAWADALFVIPDSG
jgi:FkbM family methyltransferase